MGCDRLTFFSGLSLGEDSEEFFKLQHSPITSYFILIANMEMEAITS
jgi:hypothetical protein